jgi:hypothetical protein
MWDAAFIHSIYTGTLKSLKIDTKFTMKELEDMEDSEYKDCNCDTDRLYVLMDRANYMLMGVLVNMVGAKIASLIKGKTDEEMSLVLKTKAQRESMVVVEKKT